ncbi:hypothetical protein Misp05_53750 [Micromonospora sp. NBRC 107095]|nr:hypothetical protein Misp05_53750 [Micromonospora sp. NBRC 107095]
MWPAADPIRRAVTPDAAGLLVQRGAGSWPLVDMGAGRLTGQTDRAFRVTEGGHRVAPIPSVAGRAGLGLVGADRPGDRSGRTVAGTADGRQFRWRCWSNALTGTGASSG